MCSIPYPQDGLQTPSQLEIMLQAQAEVVWPRESTIIKGYFKDRVPAVAELAEALGAGGAANATVPSKARRGAYDGIRVLDLGCGVGMATLRLAWLLPGAAVFGVDVVPENIVTCKARAAALVEHHGVRLPAGYIDPVFSSGSAYDLGALVDLGTFDLVIVRSVLYAVQEPTAFIRNALLAAKADGGRVHLLTEDYGQVVTFVGDGRDCETDMELWWRDVICKAFETTGSCPRMSRSVLSRVRKCFSQPLRFAPAVDIELETAHGPLPPPPTVTRGQQDASMTRNTDSVSRESIEGKDLDRDTKSGATVTVRTINVDTANCQRSTLHTIIQSWKDGYGAWIAEHAGVDLHARVYAGFDRMLNAIDSPAGYWCWNLMVTTITVGSDPVLTDE